MKVIDNFLPKDNFLDIKTILESNSFPWFFQNTVSGKDNDYYFIHHLYNHDTISSNYFNMIKPIIDKIKMKSLIRIKVNLTTSTETVIKHAFHEDSSDTNAKTTILYLNTCNGFTEFKDGTRVNSVENKAVTFNSNIHHTGSTCSDKKIRVVLNFVYYDK